MPFLDDDMKGVLLDERKALEDAQTKWEVLATVLLPLGTKVLFIPSVASGIMCAVLKRQQSAIQRALDDPPRRDFAIATRAKPRRYIRGRLGDDAISKATDEAALAGLRATSYLEALVRADERAAGATAAGNEVIANSQLDDASRMLDGVRAGAVLWSVALRELAGAIATYSRGELAPNYYELLAPGTTVELFDTTGFVSQQALLSTGLVVKDISLPLEILPAGTDVQAAAVDAALGSKMLAYEALAITRTAKWKPVVPSRSAHLAVRDVPSPLERVRRTSLPHAHLTAGLAWEQLHRGKFGAAVSTFERAARDGVPNALRMLGELQASRSEEDNALITLTAAAERGDVWAADDLGVLLMRLGRRKEGESVLRRAVLQGSASAALTTAAAMEAQGDTEGADQVWRLQSEARQTTPRLDMSFGLGPIPELHMYRPPTLGSQSDLDGPESDKEGS
jgi:tetratricopeptide (TPR) repeat protein